MPTLASLLIEETKAEIYARGLAVATALGLPVTSWVAGDPTRSLYHYVAEVLSTLESMAAGFVGSGFLDYATGDWLTLLADQIYNVQRVEATYASTTVRLANTGGGIFVIAPGDVVVKNSTTGKTYTNIDGGTLLGSPLNLDLVFTADESGSASSADATDIDTMVTTLLGVTCSNPTAALGLDEEADTSVRERCRAKLGTLSATGPRDAYDSVVRDSTLTGNTEITRSRTVADSVTGDVTTYVAGASGAVSGAAVTAAQAAVEEWATPLCITPAVSNCSSVTIAVTYSLWLYTSVGETTATIEAAVEAALEELFAVRPIGGDIIAPATTGKIYKSLIESTIRGVYPNHAFRVSVSAPAGDTSLGINEVAALGVVTPTVSLEAAP